MNFVNTALNRSVGDWRHRRVPAVEREDSVWYKNKKNLFLKESVDGSR